MPLLGDGNGLGQRSTANDLHARNLLELPVVGDHAARRAEALGFADPAGQARDRAQLTGEPYLAHGGQRARHGEIQRR